MPRTPEREKVFLQIGFNSPDREGSLRTIEIIGIPGEKQENGECVVSQKAQLFFDDLVVKPLFAESRRLRDCDFRCLKIWVYHPEISDKDRGYDIPKLDKNDLRITSDISSSGLKDIYILDNRLRGEEYRQWKQTAENLFSPLFRKFVAPPKPPESSGENPLAKFVETVFSGIDSVMNTVDKYGEMKRSLFFNTLVIQID